MSQSSPRLRTSHRVQTGISVVVLCTLALLNLAGALNRGTALRLLVMIEVPLLLVFVALTILRFRRSGRDAEASGADLLDRLVAEEPLLRPVAVELRAFQSLGLAIAKQRRIPVGAVPVGYTRGSMTFPVAMAVLSVAELMIVHLLVPWQWLRIVLLVLTVWGVLFLLGFFAMRMVHPHFVTAADLHLRWGRTPVLTTPLSNVASAVRHSHHAHTQPHAEGERLVLTQFQSTNVKIEFAEPVPAEAPVSPKDRPESFQVSEVLLSVDDPEALLHALTRRPEEVGR